VSINTGLGKSYEEFNSLMMEPARTLLLDAYRTLGKAPRNEIIGYFEEHLTSAQRRKIEQFLDWLYKNGLTVGHGTIDLRWYEFEEGIRPLDKEAAYQWAMKQAGV
jgi:hypothetical protein